LSVLFLAILMGLSLFDAAGPVGSWVGWTLRGAFGKISYLVPVATLVISVAAFVRREEAGRILVGSLLITFASAGVAHLASGTSPLTGGWDGLADGGGAFGALVAVPLRTYIGAWAGALACIFTAALGTCIVTKTPLRRAAQTTWLWFWAVVIWVGKHTYTAFRSLWTREPVVDAAAAPVPAVARLGEADLTEPDDDEDEPADPLTTDIYATVEFEQHTKATGPLPSPAPPVDVRQGRLDIDVPAAPRGAASRWADYQLPPVAIFRRSDGKARSARGAEEVGRILERTLQDFGVDASVTAMTRGPTVTRYEVELAAGVKVSQVLRLADDIAYALGSPDVRLIAPIPGKSAIGVEVPNRDRELVMVGDIVQSQVWRDASHPLTVALGKDISGAPNVINLAEMPHLLIAGSTGAGKSSCLNALIASLLSRARPDQVRLILIDPKMVELSHFADLPHLISPVVTHPKRASETLAWVVREMERRYELLSGVGMRNIDFYNEAQVAGALPLYEDGDEREWLPYIAVFIDELADLMMVAARAVEDSICRIAQMARAVGIHLIIATQRPSVDVVTGLIKANVPSRIAFAVASQTDSRVILDMGGADKLVGHGDMLYLPTGTSKPRRVQGAYVTEKELEELTSWIRAQSTPAYEAAALHAATSDEGATDDDDSDDLLQEAMELVVRSQMGSTSMLQRKLRVGFSRAGRLMDLLERKGVVGPQEGSKARVVLITPEQWAEMHQPSNNE
jgi:DNA segregation ATPase FtsK/SpoIIIE, S-DNA-T family